MKYDVSLKITTTQQFIIIWPQYSQESYWQILGSTPLTSFWDLVVQSEQHVINMNVQV